MTILLKIFWPGVYDEGKRRFAVHFGFFVGLFLLGGALAGMVNHYLAGPAVSCEKHVIVEKTTNNSRGKKYYLLVRWDGSREERFTVGYLLYDNYNEGDEINIRMGMGRLGYEFVKEFKYKGN